MGEEKSERVNRSPGQRLVHGSCAAFLASLIAICVQFFAVDTVNWWFVGICALFGFVLGWFVGEEAVDVLKWTFWRT